MKLIGAMIERPLVMPGLNRIDPIKLPSTMTVYAGFVDL